MMYSVSYLLTQTLYGIVTITFNTLAHLRDYEPQASVFTDAYLHGVRFITWWL